MFRNTGGAQKKLTQVLPVWYVDYFKLKTLKTQKTQEETFTFSLTPLKNLDKGPPLRKELSP